MLLLAMTARTTVTRIHRILLPVSSSQSSILANLLDDMTVRIGLRAAAQVRSGGPGCVACGAEPLSTFLGAEDIDWLYSLPPALLHDAVRRRDIFCMRPYVMTTARDSFDAGVHTETQGERWKIGRNLVSRARVSAGSGEGRITDYLCVWPVWPGAHPSMGDAV